MTPRYPVVFWDSGGTIFHFRDRPGGFADPSPAEVQAGRAARAAKALEMLGHRPPVDLPTVLGGLETELRARHALRYSFETLAAGLYRRMGLPAQLPEELLLADALAGPRYRSWLFDGVADALDALSGASVRMGLIADTVWTARMMRRALTGVGLAGHFGPVICSCDLGVSKPDARIFAAAASALRPAETEGRPILYVGDHLEKDVLGAAAAGWDAAYHVTTSGGSGGRAMLDFIDYRELVQLVCG